jgi:CheY-like chemotaxis protein
LVVVKYINISNKKLSGKIMKKILLVEDEELMIGLLQKKLIKEGYEVTVARDGEEGLKKAREVMPDLILMDIIMPKMGGLEVMEHIQKEEDLKKIPIIIISNSGQPVEIDRAQRLGAKDWLVKTDFDPQELVEKIKKQIE